MKLAKKERKVTEKRARRSNMSEKTSPSWIWLGTGLSNHPRVQFEHSSVPGFSRNGATTRIFWRSAEGLWICELAGRLFGRKETKKDEKGKFPDGPTDRSRRMDTELQEYARPLVSPALLILSPPLSSPLFAESAPLCSRSGSGGPICAPAFSRWPA